MAEKPPPSLDELTADERGRYVVHSEWVNQATLINVGFLVLCIYLVSTLIGAGASDIASRIALVAFVVAMPLLAVLTMLTELQRVRRYASYPWYFVMAGGIGQGAAVIGFGAALWHVWFVATIVVLVSGLAGLFLYRAYYRRLEKDNLQEHSRRRRA